MLEELVTSDKINSTEFPRAERNGWLEAADGTGFDGPGQECYPLVDRDCVILDGKCNCERIQGVLNCKYNTF